MEKKVYTAPRLIVHGNVEDITQQGGFNNADMPVGTPVGDDGVTSVAS